MYQCILKTIIGKSLPIQRKAFAQLPLHQNFNEHTNYALVGMKLRRFKESQRMEYLEQFKQQLNNKHIMHAQCFVVMSRILLLQIRLAQDFKSLQQNMLNSVWQILRLKNPNLTQVAAMNYLLVKCNVNKSGIYNRMHEITISKQKEIEPFNTYQKLKQWLNDVKNLKNIFYDNEIAKMAVDTLGKSLNQLQNDKRITRLIARGLAVFQFTDMIRKDNPHLLQILSSFQSNLKKASNKEITLVLSTLIKLGFDQDYPVDQLFAHLKLDNLTLYEQAHALRATLYFNNVQHYQEQLKLLSLYSKYNNSTELVATRFFWPDYKLTLSMRFMFDQVLMMIDPSKLDRNALYTELFKLHSRIGEFNLNRQSQDILNCLRHLTYVQEAIYGPYVLDIYIPDITEKRNPTLIQNNGMRFNSYEEMNKYISDTMNPNSVFVEIDGPRHFIDRNKQYYKGGNLLQRKYLNKHIRLVVIQYEECTRLQGIKNYHERCAALMQLLSQ